MQTPDDLENDLSTEVSEDCLTVNVWTPKADKGSRPVFVWIHGGGFSWGTAAHALYDGRNLAERGDMVVVSMQYRLGSFGWLDLSNAGGSASSANNGLLDMTAALGGWGERCRLSGRSGQCHRRRESPPVPSHSDRC